MAGALFEIALNDAAAQAALARLIGALQRPAAAMREIGEHMLDSTDRRFESETAPDGTPWEQLSDITLLRRIARTGRSGGADGRPVGWLSQESLLDLGGQRGTVSKRRTKTGGRTLTKKGMAILAAARILRDSGDLQDTMRYQLSDGGKAVSIGTDRVYGAMQQFGGTRAQWPHLWGDIPARPFLGLARGDDAAILEILRRHLDAAARQ